MLKKYIYIKPIKVTFYPEKSTFHMNMFLILLIYNVTNVFFYFPGAYCRKYTVRINKIILKW